MKIAFIGEALSGFGGMETVIGDVIDKLRADPRQIQCEMFFFCRNDSMDKAWLRDIRYTCSFSNIKLTPLRRARHVHAFSKWLKQNGPDIIICIDVISCWYAHKARQKSGVNSVIFAWPHFSLEHKKHAECVTWADYHLAISSGIARQMAARGVDEQRISLVYNPVAVKSTIIPAPAPGEPAVFLYVGRMKFEGQKRIKDLLDGVSRLKGEWRLHVIGDGSDFEKCRHYGQTLGIARNITWHGWQAAPWQVVENDIRNVSALLLTSSFEGFGMAILEAMSYGIPCVSSDCVSGPRDMIQPGVNGELYPPGDVGRFAARLNAISAGELTFDHRQIPKTITKFYDDNYFQNLQAAIFSKIEK